MNKLPASLITLKSLDRVASHLVLNNTAFPKSQADAAVLWDAVLETWRQDEHGFFVFVPTPNRWPIQQNSILHRWGVWVFAREIEVVYPTGGYKKFVRALDNWIAEPSEANYKQVRQFGPFRNHHGQDLLLEAYSSVDPASLYETKLMVRRLSLLGSLCPILPEPVFVP